MRVLEMHVNLLQLRNQFPQLISAARALWTDVKEAAFAASVRKEYIESLPALF